MVLCVFHPHYHTCLPTIPPPYLYAHNPSLSPHRYAHTPLPFLNISRLLPLELAAFTNAPPCTIWLLLIVSLQGYQYPSRPPLWQMHKAVCGGVALHQKMWSADFNPQYYKCKNDGYAKCSANCACPFISFGPLEPVPIAPGNIPNHPKPEHATGSASGWSTAIGRFGDPHTIYSVQGVQDLLVLLAQPFSV